MAAKRKTTTKRKAAPRKAAPRRKKAAAPRKKAAASGGGRGPEVAKPSGPSAGSLARQKASLLSELRDGGTTYERGLDIRRELDQEPMASTPILSAQELRRLDT